MMQRQRFLPACAVLTILTAGWLLFPSLAWCMETCLLDSAREGYDLRPFMEVLEDADQSLTIEQAASTALAERYGPPPKGHFNFGFTSSALWFGGVKYFV